VPCALTATVGFETTPSRLRDLRAAILGGKRLRLNKFAVGGAAGAAVMAGGAAAAAAPASAAAAAGCPTARSLLLGCERGTCTPADPPRLLPPPGVTTTLAFGDLASSLANNAVGEVLGGVADQLGPLLETGLQAVDCCACCGGELGGACGNGCMACCVC
jgi:hypothetical protein